MTAPVPRRVPRQRRAQATRQRLYAAAMAEYGRVGLEGARVEDIVAAAGVSWGTFFHYFPTKEDVILDAAVEVCRAYASAADAGMSAGQDTRAVLAGAFEAMFTAAREAAGTPLRGRMLRQVINHPGRLTAHLGDGPGSPPRCSPRVSGAARSGPTSPPNRWR